MEQFLLLYRVAIKVNLKFSSCCCRTEFDKKTHTHYKRCRDVALSLHFRQGQNNFILFHAEIHIQCIIVCMCTMKWTRVLSSELIVNLLRRSWACWRRGVESGRRRRDEGNENRCVCVCVCCRVCFFVRVWCCCFHCESMSIINTARWPFPRGRSAVYLSDTISSYTERTLAQMQLQLQRRRQCRQRGNEIWIRIEWKLRAL